MATPEQLIAALGDWRAGRGPLFARLADALARASERAASPAGATLPAERVLAAELGVSRTTVVAAYRELRERGLAATRHGSGTVLRNAVAGPAGASSPALAGLLARADASAPVIDLWWGAPELDGVVEGLGLDGAGLARHAPGNGYQPQGWAELRALVAEMLARRGAPTTPEEILITVGAQEAISLAVALVAADGRRIAVEAPGYPGALDAIARAGGQPVAVGRDGGGLRVDTLKPLLERQHVHALYVAPACNNPTGGRTASHRRERLAALATEHELTLVEDTVLADLRYDGDPGPPLWALAPERARRRLAEQGRVGCAARRLAARTPPRGPASGPGQGRAQPRRRRAGPACRPRAAGGLRATGDAAARAGAGAMRALAAALQPRDSPTGTCPAVRRRLVAVDRAAHRQRRRVRPGRAAPRGRDHPRRRRAARTAAFPEYVRVCYGPGPPVLEEAARRLARAWAAFVDRPARPGVIEVTSTP